MLVCIAIHLLFCCGFTNSVSVYCCQFIVLLWIHKQCYCFVVDSQTVLVCIAINVLFCCGFTNSVSVYCYTIYCFVVDSQTVLVCIAIIYCFVVDSQTVLVCIAINVIVLLWIHKQC